MEEELIREKLKAEKLLTSGKYLQKLGKQGLRFCNAASK